MTFKKIFAASFALAIVLVTSGFTKVTTSKASYSVDASSLQPSDERAAQDALPKAKDALWDQLATTKVKLDEEKGLYSAAIPPEVKKLDGQTIKISGFMLPLESSEKFKHFLLAKRTPTCFFCPPGAPNEIIEVFSTKPVEWDEGLVNYEGTFGLTANAEQGIFFTLKDADKS